MPSIKTILSCVVGLYLAGFLATFFVNIPAQNRQLAVSIKESEEAIIASTSLTNENSYRFINKTIAHKLLPGLDVFVPVDDSYFVTRFTLTNSYNQTYLGLKNDDFYCSKHRKNFVENPNTIFEEINFLFEPGPTRLIRSQVAPMLGNDIQPHIGLHMYKNQRESRMYDIDPRINVFFNTQRAGMYKHIGKHFACLSQEANHIPGATNIHRKDFAAEAMLNYSKIYQNRPQCFNSQKFFPETWLLYDKQSCKDFFKIFNSPAYKKLKEERRIVYIRKVGVGVHRGLGVQPVNEEEEKALRRYYMNGKLCGNTTNNYIIQNYIHNPLLIDGRKFDFRMYLLVASTNPLMAYYHDGFLRVSLGLYDKNSNEKKVLLTNLALNEEIYNDAKEGILFQGMDEEGLKVAQQWSFERLQDYLLQEGIITDKNWLDNYLRPEFKKALIHLLRASSYSFLHRSSLYELFGVDFMLDENLNLWFIEVNSSPAFSGYSQPMEKFIVKMLHDHFEIVVGLLRSRMKRAVNYINKLTEDGVARLGSDGKVHLKGLEQSRKIFAEITKNYFEKEFEPSPNNGFAKIIDENYKGVEKYLGFIEEECL